MKNLFWMLILAGLAGAGWYYMTKDAPQPASQPTISGTPPIHNEPVPPVSTAKQPVGGSGKAFRGCPAEGEGGDSDLNRVKNRDLHGAYQTVTFDWLANLSWPKELERRDRRNWRVRDAQYVAQYEAKSVTVEGFLASAKLTGMETVNCNRDDPEMTDFHIWLTPKRARERKNAIVIEVTPRIRAQHRDWTLERLDALANIQYPVRISGWLMMDPEHPEQLGKTRTTLWEIHPVMKIEYQSGGVWRTLE